MLSLCAGIGGADLAAEWTNGIEIVGQVECERYCNQVLEKHWPDVPRMKYLQEVSGDEFGTIDICVIGLPCQPFSSAGKQLGSRDGRNLWPELRRILDAQCRRDQAFNWLVLENVAGILHSPGEHYKERKGGFFQEIVETLVALGYSVGWAIYGAFEVGAPHRRERVFIVAHYDDHRYGKRTDEYGHRSQCQAQADPCSCRTTTTLADAPRTRYGGGRIPGRNAPMGDSADVWSPDCRADVADADQERCGRPCQSGVSGWQPFTLQSCGPGDTLAHPDATGLSERQWEDTRRALTTTNAGNTTYGQAESAMDRKFDGLSYRLDRDKSTRGIENNAHERYTSNGNDPILTEGDTKDHGTKEEARTSKKLRIMRNDNAQEDIQRAIRRTSSFQEEEILRCNMLWNSNQEGGANRQVNIPSQSEETYKEDVRGLPGIQRITGSPHRPEYNKQHNREYSDSLQVVPRFLAQHSKEATQEYSGENAKDHLEDGEEGRNVRNETLPILSEGIDEQKTTEKVLQHEVLFTLEREANNNTILQGMREGTSKKDSKRRGRENASIPRQELLRQELSQTQGTSNNAPLQSKEDENREVRGMWGNQMPSGSPHRPEQSKQQSSEHTNPLQVVSQLLAPPDEKAQPDTGGKDAIPLLITGSGELLPWPAIAGRWPARPGESQYEWEPARTIPRAMKLAKRVPQLKALGNAIVPQQIYPVLNAIVQIEQARL